MSQPTFELEPLVWYQSKVINGQEVRIVIRNYGQYVAWSVFHDDGAEMEESCITKGGSCASVLEARDEVFTYAEAFLHR